VDITRNRREFTALVRTEIFRFLRPIANRDYKVAAAVLAQQPPLWSEDSLATALEPYYDGHERITLDNEARNGRHTYVEPSEDKRTWRVCQVLVDPEALNDWQAEFSIDLAQAREDGKPSLSLVAIGPVVPS
jgi:hypothetical protein